MCLMTGTIDTFMFGASTQPAQLREEIKIKSRRALQHLCDLAETIQFELAQKQLEEGLSDQDNQDLVMVSMINEASSPYKL